MPQQIIHQSRQEPEESSFILERSPQQMEFLSADEREAWEERAAIMEYEGGLSRRQAEIKAFECLLNRREYLRQTA